MVGIWLAGSLLLLGTFAGSAVTASDRQQFKNAKTENSVGGKAQCISGTIPVSFTAENVKFNYDGPKNPMDLVQLFQELSWIDSEVVPRMIGGSIEVKGTYDIFAKLCFPNGADPKSIDSIQVLTHGGSLDHTYWEMAKGYSYMDAAAEAGYATFAYDRLGVGGSDHPDPISVVQGSAIAESLHVLVQALRNGVGEFKFKKVVGIGHSFGAWFTQEAATRYPEDFDALVLMGVSGNFDMRLAVFSALQAQIANTDPSGKFKHLPNGYILQGDLRSIHQYNLYYYPHFEERVLQSQHESRPTIALGEMFTLFSLVRPSTWTGPIDVVNGVNDFVHCAGDCEREDQHPNKYIATFFPSLKEKPSFFLLPETGHNLPGHHRAQEAYDHIFEFLRSNRIWPIKTEGHQEL